MHKNVNLQDFCEKLQISITFSTLMVSNESIRVLSRAELQSVRVNLFIRWTICLISFQESRKQY